MVIDCEIVWLPECSCGRWYAGTITKSPCCVTDSSSGRDLLVWWIGDLRHPIVHAEGLRIAITVRNIGSVIVHTYVQPFLVMAPPHIVASYGSFQSHLNGVRIIQPISKLRFPSRCRRLPYMW